MAVLKCSFNETDADINAAIDLLSVFGSQKITKCLTAAIPIICDVIYGNCNGSGRFLTRADCLDVKDGVCKGYWDVAARFISTSPNIGRCLTVPDCKSKIFTERKIDKRLSLEPHESSGKVVVL